MKIYHRNKHYFIIVLVLIFNTIYGFSNDVATLKRELKNAKTLKEQKAALSNLAVIYCDIDLDSALFFADSLRAIVKSDEDEVLAKLYSVYGYVYERMGNYELALENQKKSLKYSLQTKNTKLISNAYNGVGVMYDFLGDYDKALENYFKGYKIRLKDNDKVAIQQSLSNIGLVYHLKGDFTNALTYLFKARDISESIKDTPGYTSALINIGLVFQQQKEFEKALEMYEKALKIYLEKNLDFDVALAYNNIGSVLYDQKKLSQSIFYHKKSLRIKEKVGDYQGRVMSLQNIGLIYNDFNKFDSALIFLLEAAAILDSLPDPANEMEVCNTLGIVYLNKKDFKNSEKYLIRALNIYNSGINYYKIYKTYRHLALLNYNLGNFKEAYDYNEKYWALSDSIQNNENAKVVQQKEIESRYKAQKREDELKRELEEEAERKQQRIWNWFYIIVFTALLIVMLVIYRNYREKKKANNLLTERNNIISIQNVEIKKQSVLLEEKNRDITDSIQYAKRLQDAILPTETEMESALKNYFVLYKPKDIVSGDFYWMHDFSTVGLRKYLFAVVDCTGHGVPGGFVSIVGNNALNRAVNEFGLSSPHQILDKITQLVELSFESENTQIRDGMDISLISVTYENDKIKIEYSGANNPLWFVQNGELKEIKADKQPIGKFDDRKPFKNTVFELTSGDKIYLFSDGYADQFGGQNGKKFKYAQLKEKLISFGNMDMISQKNELNKIIMNWKSWPAEDGTVREFEQIDDICIAGIKL